MKWTEWNGTLPRRLDKYRRYNPDTIQQPLWIYDNKWIPIPIFNDIRRPTMSDVSIWFYSPIDDFHITRIPVDILTHYPDVPSSAYEHPRELTAYMLSDYEKYRTSPGFIELLSYVGNISIS
jgi:hypothetical protein